MSALRGVKPQVGSFVWITSWLAVILVFSANSSLAFGQDQSNEAVRSILPQEEHAHQAVTPLIDLLNEAERNNPQIAAGVQPQPSIVEAIVYRSSSLG